MARSKKTPIIERIFDQLYDPETDSFSRTVVTKDDVEEAKRYCSETLGLNISLNSNPFNFMKDIVRGNSAKKIWPKRLQELGIAGAQRTGGGAIFEFIRGGMEALEELSEDFKPTQSTPQFCLQSLSLPLASKALGRTDESWLLQVAVNLRVIESHFANGENKQVMPLELFHLQMDIKLRKVQIDALFRVVYQSGLGGPSEALITVEAKQGNQRILLEQIQRQVVAAFQSTEASTVIPVAIAAVRNKGIYVVEFQAVQREEVEKASRLVFCRDALFVLEPGVKGI